MLTKKQLIDRWKIEPWNGLEHEFATFTSERGEIYVQANNFGGKPLDKINLNRFIQKLAGLPGSEEI